jgi:hypothetical protein
MRTKPETKSLITFDYKHYRPGDPEFEAIASKITPIREIRSEFFVIHTLPYREYRRDRRGSRNESLNDLYTGDKN